DFIAGHLELRDRVGAAIYLGRAARAEYPFTAVGDGSVINLGAVRIEVMETPGHTVESISLVVSDGSPDKARPTGDESGPRANPESRLPAEARRAKAGIPNPGPLAVLTGDTLFVGDVGRPDLRASLGWQASDLGAMLFDSLH